MKKKILILSYSDIQKDNRVIKQANALVDDYEVHVAGFSAHPSRNIVSHDIYANPEMDFHYKYSFIFRKIISLWVFITKKIFILFYSPKNYEYNYWNGAQFGNHPKKFFNKIKKEKYDLIIANDITALPLGHKLAAKNEAKFLYDAHEYSPKEFEEKQDWIRDKQPVYNYFCQKYLPKADAMFTVCDSIAEEYAKKFQIPLPKIVMNSAEYALLNPTKVNPEHIKIIHHGGCMPERYPELMVQMMDYLEDNFYLEFMFVGNDKPNEYLQRLKEMAKSNPRISFRDAVLPHEIAKTINQYDIGLFLIKPTNFNYAVTLPNKLFDFIQGRLAIAIAPSTEMMRLTQKYDLGVVSEDFTPQALAKKIQELTPEKIMYYKNQSHKFAEELSANANKKIIQQTVKELIG